MSAGYERFSAQDSSFLVFEDPNTHMHLGGIAIFDPGPLATADGGVDIERIRRHVESRLHWIPRYRQRVAYVPLERHPAWVDDDHFNLSYHVRHTSLPRPGDECLNLVASQARDVAGHGEESPRPASRGLGLSEGDRRGVARVRRFTERGEWLGADRDGELDDLGIARHDPDAVEARGAEGGQDVAQHRARELVALPGAERGDEALLGVDEVLGRHGTDDHRNGGREGGVTPWVA